MMAIRPGGASARLAGQLTRELSLRACDKEWEFGVARKAPVLPQCGSPRPHSIRELQPEDFSDLISQQWRVLRGRAPHLRPIDPEVVVHDDVPESLDVRPRDVGVAIPQLLGEARHGLSDNRQLVDHGTPNHPIRLERFLGLARGELGDLVGSRDNVLEQQPLTPHR